MKHIVYVARFQDSYSARGFWDAINRINGVQNEKNIQVLRTEDPKAMEIFVPPGANQSSMLLGQLDAFGGQIDLSNIQIKES